VILEYELIMINYLKNLSPQKRMLIPTITSST
jgi:hypothetical protein